MKNKKNSGKFGGTKNLKPLNRFTPKQSPRKEKDQKTEELWAKILRHRTEIIIRIGIVVVVLLLATGFFYFSYLNKEYDSVNVVKSTGSVVTMGRCSCTSRGRTSSRRS